MSTKAKAIFVNSFKGGAGKTTLALTHCIDQLFHKNRSYENVIYIDPYKIDKSYKDADMIFLKRGV